MVSKNVKKKIKETLDWFELNTSGKRMLNGGFADVKIKSIKECKKYYYVTADTTIGDCFDGEAPKSETFFNCYYYMDKKDFHLLNNDEVKKYKEKKDD